MSFILRKRATPTTTTLHLRRPPMECRVSFVVIIQPADYREGPKLWVRLSYVVMTATRRTGCGPGASQDLLSPPNATALIWPRDRPPSLTRSRSRRKQEEKNARARKRGSEEAEKKPTKINHSLSLAPGPRMKTHTVGEIVARDPSPCRETL